MRSKKVAVIGGGAAGLCAARHCTAPGEDGGGSVTVFEQTSQLGGTWVYTDKTNTDSFGLPIHTSMYKNLRTNLPKEVMGFPDYKIPEREESYIPGKDILKFLNDYADHFDLRKYIKFRYRVDKVTPIKNDLWELEVVDLVKSITYTEIFDAVMVCNGHYHTPMLPNIKGKDTFFGLQMHSHHYREPEVFTDYSVLVIGGGPSGLDIALDISNFATKVVISHHIDTEIMTDFPSNTIQKPDVLRIENQNIIFEDGTIEEVNAILYCTGYHYNFPFLSKDCGITIEDNFVQPLYKHLIHIHRPSICFIGLPFYVCTFMLFDLQVKLFLKTLYGEIKLPSKKEMEADVQREIEWRREKGLKKKQFHMMGEFQGNYYDELSAIGNLPKIAPVYTKLHNESSRRFLEDLVNFRKDVYRIKDDNDFIQLK